MNRSQSLVSSLAVLFLNSVLLTLPTVSTASESDDSDLTGRSSTVNTSLLFEALVTTQLTPDESHLDPANSADAPALIVQLEGAGIAGLNFKNTAGYLQATNEQGQIFFNACKSGEIHEVTAQLKDTKISVTNSKDQNRAFEIKAQLTCGKTLTLLFKRDSLGGQPLGVWKIAYTAKEKLRQAVGLDWWTRALPFSWPASADYYSWGTVNVTRGDHWDVVGHEMGHGIYDLAKLGGMGGGEHKIDECYSSTLALSEGWASYFSAWISVDLNDSDAKFEFMVPRRAPIRFENIPADVCKGEKNEWRVTGFFWDLIDFNTDQEGAQETFAKAWQGLLGSRSSSLTDAAKKLQLAGINSQLLDLVWELNLMTQRIALTGGDPLPTK